MLEPRTCHLPNSTVLFRIGVDRLGQAEALQRHGTDMTQPGGQR